MSKATEYAERIRAASAASHAANIHETAMYEEAPAFSCEQSLPLVSENPIVFGTPAVVIARVGHSGSLVLLGGAIPMEKVADFVKWLGEVYGD